MKNCGVLPALFAAVLAAPGVASAQQKYPVKSVRLVLPFAAGSAVDVLARLYAQRMTEGWGQQVVVDNRTGANGIIGMELIARAAPDGYTIGMANIATLAVNPGLYPKPMPGFVFWFWTTVSISLVLFLSTWTIKVYFDHRRNLKETEEVD